MNILKVKFVVTTLVLISSIVTFLTGIVLLFELDKWFHELVKQIHVVFGLSFLVFVVIHLALNMKLYIAEAKAFLK